MVDTLVVRVNLCSKGSNSGIFYNFKKLIIANTAENVLVDVRAIEGRFHE